MTLARSVLSVCLMGVAPLLGASALAATEVETPSASSAALKHTSICRKILDRYSPLAHSHPGESPSSVLVGSATSGVKEASGSDDVSIDSVSDLARYAATQNPPFSISHELTGALQEFIDSGGGGSLNKALNANVYSISHSEGSERCFQYIFFRVRQGVTAEVAGPGISEDNVCGYGGFFATVDGESVFMQEHYDWGPGMSARIDVSKWDGDYFQTSCSVDFSYVPHFSEKTFLDLKGTCQGDKCDVLRRAALELVKVAYTSPSALYRSSMERLTSKERVQYETTERVVSGDAGTEATPGIDTDDSSNLTDTSPLRIPYVDRGTVYLVDLGHYTIGWRYYEDWIVRFVTLEDDKPVQTAAFAVGMWKGDLESTSVR